MRALSSKQKDILSDFTRSPKWIAGERGDECGRIVMSPSYVNANFDQRSFYGLTLRGLVSFLQRCTHPVDKAVFCTTCGNGFRITDKGLDLLRR